MNWIKTLVKKISGLFNWAIYLRMIIEAYIFSILISTNELSRTGEAWQHLTSYSIAAVYNTTIIILVVAILVCYLKKPDVSKSVYLTELFDGFKDKRMAKIYYLVFLLRRALIISIIIGLRNKNVYFKLGIFVSLQLIAFMYVAIIRPFDNSQENLIDIVNDAIYLIVCSIIIFVQDKGNRGTVIRNILIFLLLTNCLIIWAINIVYLIINIHKKCKERRKKSKPQINELTRLDKVYSLKPSDRPSKSLLKPEQESAREFSSKNYLYNLPL